MASFIEQNYEYWFEKSNFKCPMEGQVNRRERDIIVFVNCHFVTWLIMTSSFGRRDIIVLAIVILSHG